MRAGEETKTSHPLIYPVKVSLCAFSLRIRGLFGMAEVWGGSRLWTLKLGYSEWRNWRILYGIYTQMSGN